MRKPKTLTKRMRPLRRLNNTSRPMAAAAAAAPPSADALPAGLTWRRVTNDIPLGNDSAWLRTEAIRIRAAGRCCRITKRRKKGITTERLEVAR